MCGCCRPAAIFTEYVAYALLRATGPVLTVPWRSSLPQPTNGAAQRRGDGAQHHIIHQLAIAEALQRQPQQQLPVFAPVDQKAHHRRQQIDHDEDDIIDADQLEIGVGEFRAMLLIGDPLPDQLPHHQQIGDRRQGGEDDLEQPDLRQRHHAQLADSAD